MAFFDPSPEGRERFLKNKFKAPLRKRALEVLGVSGAAVLQEMSACRSTDAEDLENWARAVFRKCARIRSQPERLAYARACIRADLRINELIEWQKNNPDPMETLAPHEFRDFIPEDWRKLDIYYERAIRTEIELAVRQDGKPVVRLLRLVVGPHRAQELAIKLHGCLGMAAAERVMLRACESDVRNVEKYLSAAIRNAAAD